MKYIYFSIERKKTGDIQNYFETHEPGPVEGAAQRTRWLHLA